MILLKKFWNNFKNRPDVWFFYGFLLTLTLSIRKVIFFYPINGQFNEYAGIYLYSSDVFLLLTIVSAFIVLYNNNQLLSILKLSNVPRGTLFLLVFLVVWSFFSIFWSHNQPIAIFKSIKLIELYLLFIYITKLFVSHLPAGQTGGTITQNSVKFIIGVGVFQSIIGIWQFIIQNSIGLFWLKESLISANIPGVAKTIFDGEAYIRAYGLFPHPNILGGFLFLTIILTIFYKRLFHVEQIAKQHVNNYSTPSQQGGWNIFKTKNLNFWNVLISIQVLALILTFSKSAIIGLIITFFYIHKKAVVPRGTFLFKKWLLIIAILLISIYLVTPDINSLLFDSLKERLLYLNVSRGTILDNPIFGSGAGQFVMDMQNYANETLLDWQFQPVHNVFMLIWSDLGLIGLGLFILMIWKTYYLPEIVPRLSAEEDGTLINLPTIFKGVLLGFIFIMFFDHYLWDIQQGQLMLWLTLGIIASKGTKTALLT